jgi:NAD(P)-dependent dehydrogenase (short-subunit alcohol dehydrogenase family)
MITTPFNGLSTTAEVTAGVDLTGRRVIVTGGASGIGVETARAMAHAGAEVTLAVRDLAAGRRVAQEISAETDAPAVDVAPLELTDCASIAAFLAAWSGPLHVLVNNAGVMRIPQLERTPEGWEMQFATNHLGHFVLTVGLHDALAAAGSARVVVLSSSAHLRSPVVFEDIHYTSRPYDPHLAYAQSKTANVLFAVGAAARWIDDGIAVNAVMPGTIATNLMRHLSADWLDRAREQSGGYFATKTPAQGAATTVLVAASPLLEGVSGRYFEDCNEAVVLEEHTSYASGVATYALDAGNADRLWDESLRLLA